MGALKKAGPRGAPPPPRSPKEDGEVGETARYVVARHPGLTSPPMQVYRRIEELSDHATPGLDRVVDRAMSAALSPMEGVKCSPSTALEALQWSEIILKKRKWRANKDEPYDDPTVCLLG